MLKNSMFIPKVQVPSENYRFRKYCKKHPWMNFWYQINFVLQFEPKKVLEIGPGTKTVTHFLIREGVEVTTLDIDETLKPDVVGSVHELPFSDNMFDLVVCSEVLEHIPYELFKPALKEIQRVSRGPAIICLPNASGIVELLIKLPLLKPIHFFGKIPFFWKEHVFEGTHYWETGKKGYSIAKIRRDIESVGFTINIEKIYPDDPAHLFLVLEGK